MNNKGSHSSSDSDDASEKDIHYDDDTDSDDLKEDPFIVKAPSIQNIKNGDFVLVCYATKKTKQHFVGKVLTVDVEKDSVEIKYLSRPPMKTCYRFVYPEADDIDNIHIDDVIMILPPPSTAGGTKRAAQQYIFDVDLGQYF